MEIARSTDTIKLPQVCICTEVGVKEANIMMDRFFEVLPCDHEVLVSYIIREMHLRYNAYIGGIHFNSLWYRVVVDSYARIDQTADLPTSLPKVRIIAECDLVSHGLAAAYLFIHDSYKFSGETP